MKKKSLKKIAVAALSLALMSPAAVFAGTWEKDGDHDIRMNCFPSSFSKYLVFKNLIPVPKTLLGSY